MPGPFCVVCHGGVTEASFFRLKEGRKLKGWSPWTLWVCNTAVCAVCFNIHTFCVPESTWQLCCLAMSCMHGNPIFTLIEKAISIPRNSLCLQHQLLLSAFTVNSQLYMGYTLRYMVY